MDNNEIKKANRKALPKFMLIMVISLLIGGLGGFCSAKYGLNSLSDGMKSAGAFFSAYIAPWLMLAAAEQHYEDPRLQAEYLYSLIESEVS